MSSLLFLWPQLSAKQIEPIQSFTQDNVVSKRAEANKQSHRSIITCNCYLGMKTVFDHRMANYINHYAYAKVSQIVLPAKIGVHHLLYVL